MAQVRKPSPSAEKARQFTFRGRGNQNGSQMLWQGWGWAMLSIGMPAPRAVLRISSSLSVYCEQCRIEFYFFPTAKCITVMGHTHMGAPVGPALACVTESYSDPRSKDLLQRPSFEGFAMDALGICQLSRAGCWRRNRAAGKRWPLEAGVVGVAVRLKTS